MPLATGHILHAVTLLVVASHRARLRPPGRYADAARSVAAAAIISGAAMTNDSGYEASASANSQNAV